MYFTDYFTFSCVGWVTDEKSYPILYQFSFKSKDESEATDEDISTWNVLGVASTSSTFSTKFARGDYRIRMDVIDSADSMNSDIQIEYIYVDNCPKVADGEVSTRGGGSNCAGLTKRDQKLSKRALSQDTQLSLNYLNEAQNSFNQSQDAPSAVTALSIVIGTLSPTTTREDLKAIQIAAIKFLALIINSGSWYLDTLKAGPYVASLLAGTANGDQNITQSIAEAIFGITNTVTTTININAPTSCYNKLTATKFTTVADNIISSVKNQGIIDTPISSSWSSTLTNINNCLFNVRICGQTPFVYSGTNLNYVLGVQDSSTNSFGSFNVSGLTGLSSPCARFSEHTYSLSGVVNTSTILSKEVLAIATTFSKLSIVDPTNNTNLNGVFSRCVDVDPALVSLYGNTKLYSYNAIQISERGQSGVYDNITISYVNTTSQTISRVCFSSTNLGNFAVVVKKVPAVIVTSTSTQTRSSTAVNTPNPTQTTTPDGSTSGNGAVIGGVCAAIGLLVVGAAVFGARRRKRRAQREKEINPNEDEMPVGARIQEEAHVAIEMNGGVLRTRDPKALPEYLKPPTYSEFMTAKAKGVVLGPKE